MGNPFESAVVVGILGLRIVWFWWDWAIEEKRRIVAKNVSAGLYPFQMKLKIPFQSIAFIPLSLINCAHSDR